jgi:two-component system NarL family sensor kinase
VPDVPPRTGWDLQCIVEEALTNAARHGHAESARVELSGGEHLLALVIADDGCGAPNGIRIDELPNSSTGLRGMRSRAQRLGGTLTIDSGPDGTTVNVRLPVGAE